MNRLSCKIVPQQPYLLLGLLLSPPTHPTSRSPSPQDYHILKAHTQCTTTTRICPKYGPPHSAPSWVPTQHLNLSHPPTNGPAPPHNGRTRTQPSTRSPHQTPSPFPTARNPHTRTAQVILRASARGALSLQRGQQPIALQVGLEDGLADRRGVGCFNWGRTRRSRHRERRKKTPSRRKRSRVL